jgi:hypothetical protein
MDVDTKTLFFEKNENCRPMYNLVGNFSDIEEQYSKIQPTTNRPIIKITFIGTSEDKYVFNNNIEGTKVPHEGIVVKSVTGDRKRVSKVINPDYHIFSEKHNVGDSH